MAAEQLRRKERRLWGKSTARVAESLQASLATRSAWQQTCGGGQQEDELQLCYRASKIAARMGSDGSHLFAAAMPSSTPMMVASCSWLR
jgi:hypothetical protein